MNGTIDINLDSKPTLTTSMHNYSASGGTVNVDLSNYYNKVDVDSKLLTKVDVVDGKGLSTNDYTTEEKNKLQGLSNYDSTIKQSITDEVARAIAAESQLQKNIDNKTVDLSNYVVSSELTKYETSTAHSTDIATLNSVIDGKLNKADYQPTDLTPYYNKVDIDAKLNGKVDTIEGKQLSTNDYSNIEKNKLNSLNNYNDSIVKQSVSDEIVRATAAELQLQKNIDNKQVKGDYVSASQIAKYGTITAHSTDVATLNSVIDSKLNKSDYTPIDLSNYFTKNQTSGATQIATAIAAIQTTIVLTQAEYDTIVFKDNNATYIITA